MLLEDGVRQHPEFGRPPTVNVGFARPPLAPQLLLVGHCVQKAVPIRLNTLTFQAQAPQKAVDPLALRRAALRRLLLLLLLSPALGVLLLLLQRRGGTHRAVLLARAH